MKILKESVTVEMDEDDLIDILVSRVESWTKDKTVLNLYEQMYENLVESGAFDGARINIAEIVDNDYVNYCDTIEKGDKYFEAVLEAYKEDGLGDISTREELDDSGYSFIEAVDNEENPTIFLMRV